MSCLTRSQVNVEGEDLRVAPGDGGVKLERQCFAAPILHRDVRDLRTMASVEIITTAGEMSFGRMFGTEKISDGDPGVILSDHERMREHGCSRASRIMKDVYRQQRFDAFGRINE